MKEGSTMWEGRVGTARIFKWTIRFSLQKFQTGRKGSKARKRLYHRNERKLVNLKRDLDHRWDLIDQQEHSEVRKQEQVEIKVKDTNHAPDRNQIKSLI